MCRTDTGLSRLALAVALAGGIAAAQTVTAPDWRRIGGSAVELELAGPVTGPVDRVWFSADGSKLFARTAAGRVFESADFARWALSTGDAPAEVEVSGLERVPVRGARAVPAGGQVYALGPHLYRSRDGGRTWTNLTAFGEDSVIGLGQRDVAVSPRDADVLVVANHFGVWRSADGGLSWSGVNQSLPNLAVRRILATPNGLSGTRIAVDGFGALETQPGAGLDWRPVDDARLEQEAALRRGISERVNAEITAAGGTGEIRYAGAADGRLWVSLDRGRTWRASPAMPGAAGPVEFLAVDDQDPRIAVAALGGRGAHVLRTTNTGVEWEDLTTNLPDVAAHSAALDRAGRAIYVATDRGVFLARMDLDGPASAAVWASVSEALPRAAATDVQLAAGGHQLYVAVDGFGVFAAPAPHRRGTLRLVNAADFSTRAAAPGSLMSVIGGSVSQARAGGFNVPVLARGETESQIQVPFEVSGSTLSLALEAAGRTVRFGVPLQTASPAIFIDPEGMPMLLDGDTGAMLDARTVARPGSRVQILATGLGRVRPDWPTGLPAPLQNPPDVRAEVAAFVDRTPVLVTRATLAPGYVGFYLIEIQIPALVNAGPAELFLTADGQESNRVRIYLEP